MVMKAYTDLTQSKKLAEILPIESADMCYIADSELINIHEPFFKKLDKEDIPCWSLTALLYVLPQGTRLLKSETDNTYHCDCSKGSIDKWFDNLVDACYEMIIHLHEQNLL